MRFRASLLFGTVATFGLGAAYAVAQTSAAPAEFPPQSYTASQYVDSTGCAFVRVGSGPLVDWVPRVSRDRQQLCGFVPTQVGAATGEPARTGPVITFDPPADDAPVDATPTQTAAVAPATRSLAEVCEGRTGLLTGFVTASGDPVDCGPAEAPAPAPVVAPPPAPVVAAPVAPTVPVVFAPAPPAPEPEATPEPAAPAPTLAEVCEGNFGILPGFVTRSGDPVDCGPAPEAAPVVPAVAAPAQGPTLAEVCAGTFGIQPGFVTRNGDPVDCGPAPFVTPVVTAPVFVPAAPQPPAPRAPTFAEVCDGNFGVQPGFITRNGTPVDCGPAPDVAVASPMPAPLVVPVPAPPPDPTTGLRRVTLAQICAEIAVTGRSVVDVATGGAVVCPAPQVVAAANAAPTAPGAPTIAAVPAAPSLQAPPRAVTVTSAAAIRSLGPQPPRRVANPFANVTRRAVPASNPAPAAVAAQVVTPPAGFERVWSDGRINPQRGLRRITRDEAIAMGLAVR